MMGSVCAEQQLHKYGYCLANKKQPLREIDIPPRKLLARRSSAGSQAMDSPKVEEAVFSKFLPCNNVDEDEDDDPYSSDHFRIYEFKVRKCNRSRSHDWTDCPFAHPGEKARRRDPRRFHYAGTVCSEFRKAGQCSKGDNCEFSHGVFECWLHPSRYRTEACKDGKNCKRKVCFFAHSTKQLRIVPEPNPDDPLPPPVSSPASDHLQRRYYNKNLMGGHCCGCCGGHSPANNNASPTSTLMGLHGPVSPPGSPPISPSVCSPYGLSYNEALTEMIANFEAMNAIAESPAPSHHFSGSNLPWIDVTFGNNSPLVDEPPQFVLSPSTPTAASSCFSSNRFSAQRQYHGDFSGRRFESMEDSHHNSTTTRFFNNDEGRGNNGNSDGPDLGWVNDLLT